MKEKRKRNNVETLFGVGRIPCDNEIRRLIDPINPAKFRTVYDKALRMVEPYGILDEFLVLDGGVPLALDGVWYHSSQEIHCKRCLRKELGVKTTYYLPVLARTLVRPGKNAVLPVMPEMIVNGDGEEKSPQMRRGLRTERGETLACRGREGLRPAETGAVGG
jgi:hypothetical protein